jgi:GNAT superfamily N-acetyltransferase
MIEADVPLVSRLILLSFDTALRPYMTYTQHGVGAFLSVHTKYPEADPERRLLVATDQFNPYGVVGYAEFRVGKDDVGFLSYICVAESARGRGVASALVRSFIHERPQLLELQLDVFQDNAPALSFYQKLGFRPINRVKWVTRPMPRAVGTARIVSLHAAVASLTAYGFCELEVINGTASTKVGLIGQKVVRCFSVETFDNDELLGGLRGLFPDADTVLAILPATGVGNVLSDHEIIQRSDRMKLSLPGRPPR